MVLITNCVNLLSHTQSVLGTWECVQTQSFIFTSREVAFSFRLLNHWG